MAQNASHATAVLLILVLASSVAAFNITKILGEFSNFSTFSDLLTWTKLADEINRRQTITVLALDNGVVGSISSLPSDVQRKVLAVHVVLDYYDKEKLGSMKNRSAVLATLFQSTGQATNRMGFINYTKRVDSVMMFGSAEPSAPLTSEMVKSVASRPYNISVLQVSSAIVPPSISSTDSSRAKAPLPATANGATPSPVTAPTPSKRRKAAPPLMSNVPIPAPAPSDNSSADAPADAPGPAADLPIADGPTEADGPTADSIVADGPTEADAPAHERSSDDATDARGVSAADIVVVGAGLPAVVLLATIISLRFCGTEKFECSVYSSFI